MGIDFSLAIAFSTSQSQLSCPSLPALSSVRSFCKNMLICMHGKLRSCLSCKLQGAGLEFRTIMYVQSILILVAKLVNSVTTFITFMHTAGHTRTPLCAFLHNTQCRQTGANDLSNSQMAKVRGCQLTWWALFRIETMIVKEASRSKANERRKLRSLMGGSQTHT